jgi:Phage integrase family
VFSGLRFHDLRHQAITELAESQASDHTIMAIAGHVSQEMLQHYSHIRLEAKRRAVEALSGDSHEAGGYVTKHVTNGPGQAKEAKGESLSQTKGWSGREDLNLRPPGPEHRSVKIQVLHLVSLRSQKPIFLSPQWFRVVPKTQVLRNRSGNEAEIPRFVTR